MSADDRALRYAQMAAAQAADPAVIAASVKQHEKEQRERKDWHRKRGSRLIDISREVAAGSIAKLEKRVGDLRLEHKAIREGLAAGTMTAEEAARRWQSARDAREALPPEIDQVVSDMESAADLDPIAESGRMLERFPALRKRIGTVIPPLPENGNNNGNSD